MREMTTHERYADIAKKSGFSEEVVRQVLKAETESAVESLKKGYTVTFPGRCVAYPSIHSNTVIRNGKLMDVDYVKIKIKPTKSLESKFTNMEEFEVQDNTEDDDDRVLVNQIQALR